jgi:hypothetical protein
MIKMSFEDEAVDEIGSLLTYMDSEHEAMALYVDKIQRASILMAYLQTSDKERYAETIKKVEKAIHRFQGLQQTKKPHNWQMFR